MKTLLLAFATVSALAAMGQAASAAPVPSVPAVTAAHDVLTQLAAHRPAPYKAPRRTAPKSGNRVLKRTH